MNVDTFWRIVNDARNAAGSDIDGRVEALRARLSELEPDEIQVFQNIYDQHFQLAYRWDLWGAAYVMNGGCSDDGFSDFRHWLISEGRTTFEKALASPDSLADRPTVDVAALEVFGYVATELFEERGGGELVRDLPTETASPAGEEWDEEQLPSLFPRLNAIYG